LSTGIEKHHITCENMYNWDEKGFIIGLMNRTQRIMTLEALRSGRIKYTMTDGNREFVTLLACICADGTKIPVGLIYEGESHDLQDSWVEELEDNDEVYFAASTNGWTCNSLGLQWLQKILDPHTKAKAGRSKRLLIVDRHSSHVNMAFLDWADRNRIIVHIMPAHSTHRLQPLDVGLFSPLSTAYSNQLNSLMHKSLGMVSMTKRLFYPLFRMH
jgi:prepilin-type processing-associated H-X9-DG protein